MKRKTNWTVLTIILSIVDVIWFFCWYAGALELLENTGTYIVYMTLACVFPVAHVMCTYTLFSKKGMKPLKKQTALTLILSVIDVAWLFFLTSLSDNHPGIVGLIFAFPLAHAIFAFSLSFKKRIEAKKSLTVLMIIWAIVDLVWALSWLIGLAVSVTNVGALISCIVLPCMFPMAHVIFVYILSLKKQIKPLKKRTALALILSIFDFVWFVSWCIFSMSNPDNTGSFIALAFAFPLAHAIFTLVLVFKTGIMIGLRVLSIVDLVFIALGFSITWILSPPALIAGAVCAAMFPIVYSIIVFILSLKERNKTLRILTIPVIVFTVCIAAFVGVAYLAGKYEGVNEALNRIGKFIDAIINTSLKDSIATGIFIVFDAYAIFLSIYILVISVKATKRTVTETLTGKSENSQLPS